MTGCKNLWIYFYSFLLKKKVFSEIYFAIKSNLASRLLCGALIFVNTDSLILENLD